MKKLTTLAALSFFVLGALPLAESAQGRLPNNGRKPNSVSFPGSVKRSVLPGTGFTWVNFKDQASALANEWDPRLGRKELSNLVGRMQSLNGSYIKRLDAGFLDSSSYKDEMEAFTSAYLGASRRLQEMRSNKIAKDMTNTAKALGQTSEEDGVNAAGVSKDSSKIELSLNKAAKAAGSRKDSKPGLTFVREAPGKVEEIAGRLAKGRGIKAESMSLVQYVGLMKEAAVLFQKESKAPSRNALKTADFVVAQTIRILEEALLYKADAGMNDLKENKATTWLMILAVELDKAVSLDHAKAVAQRTADEAINEIHSKYRFQSSRDPND